MRGRIGRATSCEWELTNGLQARNNLVPGDWTSLPAADLTMDLGTGQWEINIPAVGAAVKITGGTPVGGYIADICTDTGGGGSSTRVRYSATVTETT